MATKILHKAWFLLHLFAIALLIGYATNVYGQTPAYLHYDVNDGLPGNVVYCAAQDDRGFMWFGTDKGLACFDGTRFRVFGVKDGLPDPEVLNLKKDSKGRLWIFCFRQKPCYYFEGKIVTEKEDQMLREIDIEGGLGDIYEDSKGRIWLFAKGWQMYLIPKNDVPPKEIRPPTIINNILEINKETFSVNIGCFISNDSIRNDSIVGKINRNFLAHSDLLGAVTVSKNIILYSFRDATYLISINGLIGTVENKILDFGGRVYVDRNKHFWICTTSHGAVRIGINNLQVQSNSAFLENKKINAIQDDSKDGTWFCTSGEGIFYLPKNTSSIFTTADGLLSRNITKLTNNASNTIIGGDDQGNLYSFNNQTTILYKSGSNVLNRTRAIQQLNEDKYLIASDLGINLFKNQKFYPCEKRLAGKFIQQKGNQYFFGTAAGLYPIQSIDPIVLDQKIIYQRTTAGALDFQNFLWVGGTEGLYSNLDTFKQNWGLTFPMLKARVIDIESDKKNLWIATPTEGLLKIKTNNGKIIYVESVNSSLSKPIENIQSIFAEPQGRIWLATNKGVFGIDQNYNVIHFNKHNGLVSDDVNDIVVYNDTLWAATVEGLSKVCISNKNTTDFPTYYTRLQYRIHNQEHVLHLMDSIASPIEVHLSSEASLIELGIAGLDYTSRGNMKYECIITQSLPPIYHWTPENLVYWIKKQFTNDADTTGTENGLLNFGAYLAPAFYIITSKGINTNNTSSKTLAAIHLYKAPFWYQTIWFYLAIFGGIGYFFWRIFKTNLENKQLQTAVSELRLQTLQSQINPHFIGNSVNAIQQFFFPPDVVKASEYISTFTRLLRTTMDFSERPFVSIQEELAYSKDYLSMINLRFGDKFRFNIEIDESIAPETPFPSMLLQPILENATIHGISPEENSYLLVKIVQQANQKIICTITDNGVGIHQKQQQKKDKGKHVSKGISLLMKKVKTLNDLYHIHCELSFRDLSEQEVDIRGTEVILSYVPSK